MKVPHRVRLAGTRWAEQQYAALERVAGSAQPLAMQGPPIT